MATFSIYDETANKSKSITVDFLGNVLSNSSDTSTNTGLRYYFSIRTGAKDTDNIGFPNTVVLGLDELALNGVKQRKTDTAADYVDLHEMITDYLFDMVNGHAANLYSSGVELKSPMDFS